MLYICSPVGLRISFTSYRHPCEGPQNSGWSFHSASLSTISILASSLLPYGTRLGLSKLPVVAAHLARTMDKLATATGLTWHITTPFTIVDPDLSSLSSPRKSLWLEHICSNRVKSPFTQCNTRKSKANDREWRAEEQQTTSRKSASTETRVWRWILWSGD